MKIQRRLGLSFFVILLLYGLNLGVYYWGNQKRSASVETLRKALSRQLLFSSIQQNLTNLQKQVTLLSQVVAEVASEGLGPEQITQFHTQTETIAREIKTLYGLSDPAFSAEIESFDKMYFELRQSWRVFYENFGINHTQAIMELALRADPFTTRLMVQMLPQLYQDEEERVEHAMHNYYEAARLTDWITTGIFSFSILLAMCIAFFTSNTISKGLTQLKKGAARIGSGTLDYRIPVQSNDELGQLADTFNEMGQNLLSAQTKIQEANQSLAHRHQEVEKQREKAEALLLNILPKQIADELKTKGIVEPKYFEDVSIMFTDFVGFTASTEKMAADRLVSKLHDYFTAFDHIVTRYQLEKLKTIGDSYMCVAGLPVRNPAHPVDMVLAGLEMIEAVKARNTPENTDNWAIRIGIHTGAVIAGVVGIKKFSFDIWGDSVNDAKRMESSGLPNQINLSDRTYSRVKDFFECDYRGEIPTKGEKTYEMYQVKGVLAELADLSKDERSPAFLHRYRLYFQNTPPQLRKDL